MDTMTKTEEKLALAKELGLVGYVNVQEEAKRRQLIVDRLVGLRLHPTTHDEIREKLTVWIKDSDYWSCMIACSSLVGFLGGGIGALIGNAFSPWAGRFVGIGILGVTVLLTHVSNIERADIRDMYLGQWCRSLPYGALLAVKEAKEKGVTNFRIFYPSVARPADPVITGVLDEVLVEVFSWDDGKLYD